MKILTILAENLEHKISIDDEVVLADSALVKTDKPFFVPDEEGPYVALAAVAVPMIKVGKSIMQRFAGRYYSEYYPAVIFRDEGRLSRLLEMGKPVDSALSFDGALHIGKGVSKDSPEEIEWRYGDSSYSTALVSVSERLSEFLEQATRREMVRIGDMIVLPISPLELNVEPDCLITVNSCNQELMRVKIK